MAIHLSLRAKLLLPMASVLALLLTLAALAIHGSINAEDNIRSQRDIHERTVGFALQVRSDIESAVSRLYQTLTWEAVGFDAAKIKEHDAKLLESLTRVSFKLKQKLAQPFLPEADRKLLQNILAQIQLFSKSTKDTIEMKSSPQGLGLAAMSLTGAENAAAVLNADLSKFEELSRQGEAGAAAAAQASSRRTMILTAALAAIAVVSGALLARWGYQSVRRPLGELQTALGRITGGDLSRPLQTHARDELGALMNGVEQMRQHLQKILRQVADASGAVTHAATEIAAGTLDLSVRTEQQSSAVQRTASSMQQMSGSVGLNAQSAQQANRYASSASNAAVEGQNVVTRVVTTMREISAQSSRIAEITGVIDGIAFQTNILALNAAVEAARAGEQGRGFAVVASEVRNLAQRSASAAREIKTLISTSAAQVERGSALAGEAGETIQKMVSEVERVNQIIQGIDTATAEQSAGVHEMTGAVSIIDQMTQQNAALVEQSSAAAEMLKVQALSLSSALTVFDLGVAA